MVNVTGMCAPNGCNIFHHKIYIIDDMAHYVYSLALIVAALCTSRNSIQNLFSLFFLLISVEKKVTKTILRCFIPSIPLPFFVVVSS